MQRRVTECAEKVQGRGIEGAGRYMERATDSEKDEHQKRSREAKKLIFNQKKSTWKRKAQEKLKRRRPMKWERTGTGQTLLVFTPPPPVTMPGLILYRQFLLVGLHL